MFVVDLEQKWFFVSIYIVSYKGYIKKYNQFFLNFKNWCVINSNIFIIFSVSSLCVFFINKLREMKPL